MTTQKQETLTDRIEGLEEAAEWEQAYLECVVEGSICQGLSPEEKSAVISESSREIELAKTEVLALKAILALGTIA